MAVFDEYLDLLTNSGRAVANALFPNDFEYYSVALELTTSDDKTVEYLTFPVPPEAIRVVSTQITNIRKTVGGVIAMSTPTYIPIRINIKGTFGRKLRILLGSGIDLGGLSALRFSATAGVYSKEQAQGTGKRKLGIFNPTIKTGYGVTKILQSIYDKSNALDDKNQPFRCYFYNPMLGESYLIKINDLTLNQDKNASNMLWNYSLDMTTLAPLDSLGRGGLKGLVKNTGMNIVQGGVNLLAKDAVEAVVDATRGSSIKTIIEKTKAQIKQIVSPI